MTTSKHTPGPWEYLSHSKEIVSRSGAVVAQITGIPRQLPGYAPSNAQLIASAPELLNMLELLLVECDAVQDQACDAIPKLLERAKDARMVVSKAKGESS